MPPTDAGSAILNDVLEAISFAERRFVEWQANGGVSATQLESVRERYATLSRKAKEADQAGSDPTIRSLPRAMPNESPTARSLRYWIFMKNEIERFSEKRVLKLAQSHDLIAEVNEHQTKLERRPTTTSGLTKHQPQRRLLPRIHRHTNLLTQINRLTTRITNLRRGQLEPRLLRTKKLRRGHDARDDGWPTHQAGQPQPCPTRAHEPSPQSAHEPQQRPKTQCHCSCCPDASPETSPSDPATYPTSPHPQAHAAWQTQSHQQQERAEQKAPLRRAGNLHAHDADTGPSNTSSWNA